MVTVGSGMRSLINRSISRASIGMMLPPCCHPLRVPRQETAHKRPSIAELAVVRKQGSRSRSATHRDPISAALIAATALRSQNAVKYCRGEVGMNLTQRHDNRRAYWPALLAFAVTLAAGAASAQPTQEQINAVRSSCRSDYMSYCRSVTPGGPEALQCLRSTS